jgi:septal ring factor EnvC (AmiA/AmiB activator)
MRSYEFTAIKILEKYHFTKEDAEAFLETIKEAKSEDLATKADILRLEKEINEIKKEINEIKKDIRLLDVKIESTKNQLVIWVFGIMFAMSGLIIGVLKFT